MDGGWMDGGWMDGWMSEGWTDEWGDWMDRLTEFISDSQCLHNKTWLVGWSKTNGPFPQATEKQESLKTKSPPNAEQGKCKKSHQTFRERRQVLYKGTEFAREHIRTAGPSLGGSAAPTRW